MVKHKSKGSRKYAGYIPTWVVGITYCSKPVKLKKGQQVYLEPEPHNPVDRLAMAVYDRKGNRVGYIPRYDAEILTPEVNKGRILLKGVIGANHQQHRISLRLEVHLTDKSKSWFRDVIKDDVRAIIHRSMLDLWNHKEDYSAVTIKDYRELHRKAMHQNEAFNETIILYRLLKGVVFDKFKQEKDRCRYAIIDALKHVRLGVPQGCDDLTIIPLFRSTETTAKEVRKRYKQKGITRKLKLSTKNIVRNYRYPEGAIGAIYLIGGRFEALHYFRTPEQMEYKWFAMLDDYKDEVYGGCGWNKSQVIRELISIVKRADIDTRKEEDMTRVSIEYDMWGSAYFNHKGRIDSMELTHDYCFYE